MLILLIQSCAPLTEINRPSRPQRIRRLRGRFIELTAGGEEGGRLSRMLSFELSVDIGVNPHRELLRVTGDREESPSVLPVRRDQYGLSRIESASRTAIVLSESSRATYSIVVCRQTSVKERAQQRRTKPSSGSIEFLNVVLSPRTDAEESVLIGRVSCRSPKSEERWRRRLSQDPKSSGLTLTEWRPGGSLEARRVTPSLTYISHHLPSYSSSISSMQRTSIDIHRDSPLNC